MTNARKLTSLFFPAALLLALPAEAAKPLIDTVIPNASLTSITINGTNLGGLSVYLSGMVTPLTVTSSSPSQIVANLPAGIAAGSYAVRVQGAGNGNFDEFFATFSAAGSAGGGCISYANSANSGAFGATLSITLPGAYAVNANATVNIIPPGAGGWARCTMTDINGFWLDDAFATAAASMNEVSMALQATLRTTTPTQLFVTCISSPTPPGGGTASVYHSKITAVCLTSLVSPSP